jgi:hypothetical protein
VLSSPGPAPEGDNREIAQAWLATDPVGRAAGPG